MSFGAFHPSLPMLLVTFLLLASLIVSRLRLRWPLWVRVLARVAFFIVLTPMVQVIVDSPLQPRFSDMYSGQRFWEQLIEGAW